MDPLGLPVPKDDRRTSEFSPGPVFAKGRDEAVKKKVDR